MNSKPRDSAYFRPLDIFVVVVFLLIAVFSINMFWHDFMRTLSLQNVEPAGTVVIKKNTVQRRIADRALWDRLAKESPVYIGDIIRLADVSAATLYIDDNGIDLDENTLIRITRAADGKTLQIVLSEGNLSLATGSENGNVSFEYNGIQVHAQPNTVLSASSSNAGDVVVQVSEGNAQLIEADGAVREISSGTVVAVGADGAEKQRNTVDAAQSVSNARYGRLSIADGSVPDLKSPAFNSLFRYSDNPPLIHFQWSEVEDADSYIIEVSNVYDFSSPRIRKQISAVSLTESGLEEGAWFWRVMPVFPRNFGGSAVFSTASFFRMEQIPAVEAANTANTEDTGAAEELSLSQWLAAQAPSNDLPEGFPPNTIPAHFRKAPEPNPPVPLPPARTSPARTPPARTPVREQAPSVSRLPAPQNLTPRRGTTFGLEDFRSQRSIAFSWSAVSGANAYIFTFYQQTTSGRRQLIRETINSGTSYTLTNLSLLDRGTFIWQVEALSTGRGGAIERRGTAGESTFIVDFPSSAPLQIETAETINGD